jgi:hypothetical protein
LRGIHPDQLVLAASKALKEFLAIDGLQPDASEGATAVEQFLRLRPLVKVPGHNILNQFAQQGSKRKTSAKDRSSASDLD